MHLCQLSSDLFSFLFLTEKLKSEFISIFPFNDPMKKEFVSIWMEACGMSKAIVYHVSPLFLSFVFLQHWQSSTLVVEYGEK